MGLASETPTEATPSYQHTGPTSKLACLSVLQMDAFQGKGPGWVTPPSPGSDIKPSKWTRLQEMFAEQMSKSKFGILRD